MMSEDIEMRESELSTQQLELANYMEKCAKCISIVQVDALRMPFIGPHEQCHICGVSFWSMGFILPSQRHHCYCCGKTLCNACTLVVDMENGHRSQEGHYIKDFVWQGKFCITHELARGETIHRDQSRYSSGWFTTKNILLCTGYVVNTVTFLISVIPAVKPLFWTYRLIRFVY